MQKPWWMNHLQQQCMQCDVLFLVPWEFLLVLLCIILMHMVLDLPVIADLISIRNRRQVLIDDNLRRQNLKRRSFDYQVGQDVLVKTVNPAKLETRAHGPYQVLQVHTNGNVTIQRAPNVLERINIRRVVPYCHP
jgi:hypothetical protein